MKRKIILASASPRRKELLKSLGLSFRVVKSNTKEQFNPRLKPRTQAEALSYQKALNVSKKYSGPIIIACDTVVDIDGEILGKPGDYREAKRFLRKLSGKTHSVITAITIIDTKTKKKVTTSVETYVTMRPLKREEIDAYVLLENVLDFAGGYAIQGRASIFIEKIKGDYFNVVGLPLFTLSEQLKKMGIRFL